MKAFLFFLALAFIISFESCKIESELETSSKKLTSSTLLQDEDFVSSFQLSQDMIKLFSTHTSNLNENEFKQLLSKINNLPDENKLKMIENELGITDNKLQKILIRQNEVNSRLKLRYNGFSDLDKNKDLNKVVKESFQILDSKMNRAQLKLDDSGTCEVADINCRQDGAAKASIAMVACAFAGPGAGLCATIVGLNAAYDLYACARNYSLCIKNT